MATYARFTSASTNRGDEWKRFTDRHAAEMNSPSFPPHLAGPWSKLRHDGAIALILHLIRWACDGGNEGMIDGVAIRDASKVTAYIQGSRPASPCVYGQ